MSCKLLVMVGMLLVIACGCVRSNAGNDGLLQSYLVPVVEAAWIRNGDPIVFENHRWYPVDDTEALLDEEVFQVGEYQNVPIFVLKIDARPYDRLYTKFAKSKFRYFERASND